MPNYPNPPIPGDQPYQVPSGVFGIGPTYNTCPGHLTHDNCLTNKDVICVGNQCGWYGDPCPTNGPFLLSGECFDCSSFTDPDLDIPTTTVFTIPLSGSVATAQQLNVLRHSILNEYSTRRWILEDPNRATVVSFSETVGDLIEASPNIENLGTMIEFMIDRGDIPYQPYDFTTDASYDNAVSGFYATDSGVNVISSSPPVSGTTIESTEIYELMNIVDNLRRSCVCHQNCTCHGHCLCNWNCQCNY